MTDELLSAAIGAGVTCVGWFFSWRRSERSLHEADIKTQQRLDDHVAECDRRYGHMEQIQGERHHQNQEQLAKISNQLESFINRFIRTGGR